MKETKFRAWDKQHLVMYPVVGMKFESDGQYVWLQNKQGVRIWVSITAVELMQYTGHNDSGNKEIYAGDIVKHYSYIKTKTGVVKRYSYTKTVTWVEFLSFLGWNIGATPNYEVVGNIYENSNLLPKENR